jgi:hypothetical protein
MATFEALTNQMGEMKLSVEGLEKERDFYFNKVSSFHSFRCFDSSVGSQLTLVD